MDFPWVWRLRPPGHPAFRNRISQSLLSDCDINFLQGKFFFILLFVWLSQKLLRTKCWLLNAKFDRCSIRTHAHTRVQKGHRKIFWIWRLRPLRNRALSSSTTQLLRYLFDNTFSYCKICFVLLLFWLSLILLRTKRWFFERKFDRSVISNPRTYSCTRSFNWEILESGALDRSAILCWRIVFCYRFSLCSRTLSCNVKSDSSCSLFASHKYCFERNLGLLNTKVDRSVIRTHARIDFPEVYIESSWV